VALLAVADPGWAESLDSVVTLGAGYGALGPSGSGTLLVGRGVQGLYPEVASGKGAVLRAEVGARGVKAGIGFGQMLVLFAPSPLAMGASVRGSAMLLDGAPYLGVEADVALAARLSLGVFKEVGGRRTTRVTLGVGIGF
jgi:hypothetical protein